MRKVAWRLVPLLSLCFMLNILDRFNVAVAALTMNDALTRVLGVGTGCMTGGATEWCTSCRH